jgi:hypothetical protein
MRRTNLFFKVEIEHDEDESPEKIAAELARMLARFYSVRAAEVTHFTTTES